MKPKVSRSNASPRGRSDRLNVTNRLGSIRGWNWVPTKFWHQPFNSLRWQLCLSTTNSFSHNRFLTIYLSQSKREIQPGAFILWVRNPKKGFYSKFLLSYFSNITLLTLLWRLQSFFLRRLAVFFNENKDGFYIKIATAKIFNLIIPLKIYRCSILISYPHLVTNTHYLTHKLT